MSIETDITVDIGAWVERARADPHAYMERFHLDSEERAQLLDVMRKKCAARKIFPERGSMSVPEVSRRARKEWQSLELEIGEVPDFVARFAIVEAFYLSLPWESAGA